jgi:hypothetical protein
MKTPGSNRFRARIFLVALLLLLAGGFDFVPSLWSQPVRSDKISPTGATSLRKTIVSPHLEQPIATFNLIHPIHS